MTNPKTTIVDAVTGKVEIREMTDAEVQELVESGWTLETKEETTAK